RLCVALELLAVPEGFHFLADERAILLEQLHRRPQVVAVVQLEKTVERRPAEHPRMGEVPALAADLPDSLIRLLPPFAGEPAKADERALRIAIEGPSAAHEVRRCADDLAVDVELDLVRGCISDAHRPRAAMAGEVQELALLRRLASVDVVEDAQLRPGSAGRVEQPLDEGLRLLGVPEAEEGASGQLPGTVAEGRQYGDVVCGKREGTVDAPARAQARAAPRGVVQEGQGHASAQGEHPPAPMHVQPQPAAIDQVTSLERVLGAG